LSRRRRVRAVEWRMKGRRVEASQGGGVRARASLARCKWASAADVDGEEAEKGDESSRHRKIGKAARKYAQ
jgi:hypothetical protein